MATYLYLSMQGFRNTIHSLDIIYIYNEKKISTELGREGKSTILTNILSTINNNIISYSPKKHINNSYSFTTKYEESYIGVAQRAYK